MRAFAGILTAVILHAAFLLFGGLLLPEAKDDHGSLQEVELVGPEPQTEAPQPEPPPPPQAPPPPPEDEPQNEAVAAAQDEPCGAAPALDAASLSAIEDALFGRSGGGDFGGALDLASGGRIGGTGRPGGASDELEKVFSTADLDQQARILFDVKPLYPAELFRQRVQGKVVILFVVDASGKVTDARIEESSHAAFERPALDAVKQWKFDPAVRAGKRVASRLRRLVSFKPPQ